MISGSLSRTFSAMLDLKPLTFSAMLDLKPLAIKLINILFGMSSSQTICWIRVIHPSADSSACWRMFKTSMSKLFLVFQNRTKKDSLRFGRVVFAAEGNAKYHCYAISPRWNTKRFKMCASVKECRVHHCMNKVHHWLALTFDTSCEFWQLCRVVSSWGRDGSTLMRWIRGTVYRHDWVAWLSCLTLYWYSTGTIVCNHWCWCCVNVTAHTTWHSCQGARIRSRKGWTRTVTWRCAGSFCCRHSCIKCSFTITI